MNSYRCKGKRFALTVLGFFVMFAFLLVGNTYKSHILVGIGTVLSDNPRLTVRLVNGQNPRPIVVDSQLRIPLNCKLYNENSVTPWVAATEEHPAGRRAGSRKAPGWHNGRSGSRLPLRKRP